MLHVFKSNYIFNMLLADCSETHVIHHSDTLISPSGKILIPGIQEAVAPLSDDEWRMYQDIEFDVDDYKNKIGVSKLMYSNKVFSLFY